VVSQAASAPAAMAITVALITKCVIAAPFFARASVGPPGMIID
jgi:hypothetical protein